MLIIYNSKTQQTRGINPEVAKVKYSKLDYNLGNSDQFEKICFYSGHSSLAVDRLYKIPHDPRVATTYRIKRILASPF